MVNVNHETAIITMRRMNIAHYTIPAVITSKRFNASFFKKKNSARMTVSMNF